MSALFTHVTSMPCVEPGLRWELSKYSLNTWHKLMIKTFTKCFFFFLQSGIFQTKIPTYLFNDSKGRDYSVENEVCSMADQEERCLRANI